MAATIFEQIIAKELPADIVYEDDLSLAFNDVNPQAPKHILIVPKQHVAKLSEAGEEHKEMLGHLLLVANKVAVQEGLGDFRLVVNNGKGAQQTVFHLHIHLLAGRPFAWPPG